MPSPAPPNPFPGMNPLGAHPLNPPAADAEEAAWIAERRSRTSGGVGKG